MRNLQATKDTHEREEDEAERLNRPNTKVKPPRRDLRREKMEVDRDPDLDGDPDLSLNYKNIGGSLVERVAARFLTADAEGEEDPKKGGVPARWNEWLDETKAEGKKKVPNPNPETKTKSPEVSFSTALKDKAFFQQALKDYQLWAKKTPEAEGEKAPSAKPKAEPEERKPGKEENSPKEKASPEKLAENARDLLALAESDPHVKSVLDSFKAGGNLHGMAQANPAFPIAQFKMQGLPDGVTTLGDVADALSVKPAPPKKKEETSPKKGDPSKEAPKSQSPKEAPKSEKNKEGEKAKFESIPRRPVEKAEVAQAQKELEAVLPPSLAERFSKLHPDDKRELSKTFQEVSSLGNFKTESARIRATDNLRNSFTLDPEKVEFPTTWDMGKGEVPLEDLTEPEQFAAIAAHRMQVIAVNLGTRKRAIDTLVQRGVKPEIAAQSIDLELNPPKTGKTAKEHAKIATEHATKVQEAAQNRFIAAATSKDPVLSHAKRMDTVSAILTLNPEAQKLAYADLQANDFREVSNQFLSGPKAITKYDSVPDILFKLRQASDLFQQKAWDYPEDVASNPDPARIFRKKVLARLSDADPKKFREVSRKIAKKEAKEYDQRMRQFESASKTYEDDLFEYEEAFEVWAQAKKDAESEPVKGQKRKAFNDPPPVPPKEPKAPSMPEGYLEAKKAKKPHGNSIHKDVEDIQSRTPKQKAKGKKSDRKKEEQGILDRILSFFGGKRKKEASGLYSSYQYEDLTMGNPSSRTAVYHGKDPYPKGELSFASPYEGWADANQSELSSIDHSKILSAAREWLRSPILSKNVEGMSPDARFRAALDLAIRDTDEGSYSAAISATVYNELLAKLTGSGEDVSGATVHKASLRKEARLCAQRVASYDPELAYDLLGLSDSLSTGAPVAASQTVTASVEDTYEALRSTVIRSASTNPQVREHLQPVFRLIKTLDEVRTLRAKSQG